jgi:hypothetical protein
MRRVVPLLVLLACTPRPVATVWFTSAPDVPGDTPVVLDAQVIGTTGTPTIIAGALRVPLYLPNPDCLRDDTLFVINHDHGGLRLVAHPRGNPVHLTPSAPGSFRGAATIAEYWLLRAQLLQ